MIKDIISRPVKYPQNSKIEEKENEEIVMLVL
jgi:hypothetical protein